MKGVSLFQDSTASIDVILRCVIVSHHMFSTFDKLTFQSYLKLLNQGLWKEVQKSQSHPLSQQFIFQNKFHAPDFMSATSKLSDLEGQFEVFAEDRGLKSFPAVPHTQATGHVLCKMLICHDAQIPSCM